MAEADRARRLRLVLGWVLLALAAAGVTYGLITLFSGGDDPGDDDGPAYRFATTRHVNERGGYAFNHPPDWKVRDEGSVSRVTAPEGDTVITFGIGPEGKLEAAETAFVTELQGQYRDVQLAALQVRQVGPNPALQVSGSGRNPQGARVTFVAITVAAGGRNYSVGVFTAAGGDLEKVVPPSEEIVDSFRPLG